MLSSCKQEKEEKLEVDFTADVQLVNIGEPVNFKDASKGRPESFKWSFPGGTPETSSGRITTVGYYTAETYSFTLELTNPKKSDEITKQDFITVGYGVTTTLYAGKNKKGTAVKLGIGEHTDIGFKIASLSINDGLRVKLYRDEKSGGGYLGLEESQNDLTQSGWYDNIVKVVVEEYAEDEPLVKHYNYVLGTQIFSPYYGLTGANRMAWTYDAAKEMYKMGSNVLKTFGESIEASTAGGDYKKILNDFDFTYIYLWVESMKTWHPLPQWSDDLTTVYNQMYRFAQNILKEYNNTGKTFYLGHWEGDWTLKGDWEDANQNWRPSDHNIQGMIDWLNIRQKAVEDAKRDTPHSNVYVWHYTEANRITDIENGNERVVNAVLPNTTVDYLALSSWDIQLHSSTKVKEYIDYMDVMIPVKDDVPNPGKRVFISESGRPTAACDSNQETHNNQNITIFIKYFDAGVSQILYWQMYSNEQHNGHNLGYFLIDENGVKWKLYYSFKAFYCNAKEYVQEYIAAHGNTPNTTEFNAWASRFLKTLL